MSSKSYTNKIEFELGDEIKIAKNLLPAGVKVHEVEIVFWPNYKPRGRAALSHAA